MKSSRIRSPTQVQLGDSSWPGSRRHRKRQQNARTGNAGSGSRAGCAGSEDRQCGLRVSAGWSRQKANGGPGWSLGLPTFTTAYGCVATVFVPQERRKIAQRFIAGDWVAATDSRPGGTLEGNGRSFSSVPLGRGKGDFGATDPSTEGAGLFSDRPSGAENVGKLKGWRGLRGSEVLGACRAVAERAWQSVQPLGVELRAGKLPQSHCFA